MTIGAVITSGTSAISPSSRGDTPAGRFAMTFRGSSRRSTNSTVIAGPTDVVNLGKFPILGVNIDAVDYEYAVSSIVAAAEEGRPFAVSATAVHGVMEGAKD